MGQCVCLSLLYSFGIENIKKEQLFNCHYKRGESLSKLKNHFLILFSTLWDSKIYCNSIIKNKVNFFEPRKWGLICLLMHMVMYNPRDEFQGFSWKQSIVGILWHQ